jgi:hypothetical protein
MRNERERKRLPINRSLESSAWERTDSPKTRCNPIERIPLNFHHLNHFLLYSSLPHPWNKHWRPHSQKARHHGCSTCGHERAVWVRQALKKKRRSLQEFANKSKDYDYYDYYVYEDR